MATITAADVNTLRKQTGAGMMDCKKALVEADGDFEKAVEILRKQGQKVAAKRGDRDTNEGRVLAAVSADGKAGALAVLSCETDFVAKNDQFGALADLIVQMAVEAKPESLEALLALPVSGTEFNLGERITEEVGKTGEKMQVSHYKLLCDEMVLAYNHPGNQMASLVAFSKNSAKEAAHDVAMQVAAMAPVAIDKDDVPRDVIDKEIEIGKEQAINEGKPAELAEKIAAGKLNKFFKENTLVNQVFIKENKKTVGQYLKEADPEIRVTAFDRYSLV